MRTGDSNNTHEKFEKLCRVYNGVLQPEIVLKTAGCFLVISEAPFLKCLKSKFYRKFLDKTLPLSVKL